MWLEGFVTEIIVEFFVLVTKIIVEFFVLVTKIIVEFFVLVTPQAEDRRGSSLVLHTHFRIKYIRNL